MEFYWNWWVIATLFIYIVVGGVGALFVADQYGGKTRHSMIAVGITGWLIGFGVWNGLTYLFSDPNSVPYARSVDVSSELGLRPGVSYPVQLGTRVQGSGGNAYFYGGIFSSSGRVAIQPGSSVSMGFRSGEVSYILELPMSKVRFVEAADTRTATVEVYLVNKYLGDAFGHWQITDKQCGPMVVSLSLLQDCQVTNEFHLSDVAERRGLGPVVNEHLDSATITLPRELYAELLGTP